MPELGHLQIDEVRLSPGDEWLDESDAWRFVRASQGAAYWLETARSRSLSTGEVLVLAPQVKAVVRASQLNEVLLHGFNFAPSALCGFFTLAERRFLDSGAAGANKPVQFLPSTHPSAQHFGNLVARQASGQDIATRAELLGLAAGFLSGGFSNPQPSPTRASTAEERFQQVIAQMPDVEIIQRSPAELADLCGCSSRHFNRLFRQQFGQSPRCVQTELRLLKARQLLSIKEYRIVQIALDSGYRSMSLFNALFKRRFGMSPSEWRRQAIKSTGKLCVLICCFGLFISR